jgi:GH25 family lysozyme M1 (1,4-beta-N-acetylmuramidase)
LATIVDLYQKYNNVTDWPALSHVVDGAWIKVTDGVGPAAVRADAYVAGCRSAGIRWGGYHFAEPGDARAQARAFVAELKRLGWAADDRHLVPVLDLENNSIPTASRAAFARAFLEEVHAELGVHVALYSSTSWLASLNPDSWPYDWDRTWAAEYSVNDGVRHVIVHYGGRVDAHQYTSAGSLPGVAGRVDLTWTADIGPLLAREDDMGYADDVMQWMQNERLGKLPAGHRFYGKNVGDMLLDATSYADDAATAAAAAKEAAEAVKADVAALRAELGAAVANAVQAYLAEHPLTVTASVDLPAVAKAVNDDADARDRDGDPTTGRVS